MSDTLLVHTPAAGPGTARLVLHPERPAGSRIHPYLFGKFCEHLGRNIYQGMQAQVLRNPTFGRWPFQGRECPVNGGHVMQSDPAKVLEQIRAQTRGWPGIDPELAVQSYTDGLAFPWLRLGGRDRVRVSPDVGPHGDRAQRLEIRVAGDAAGCWQPLWLPLHRTRTYELRLLARATAAVELRAELGTESGEALAAARFGLGTDWRSLTARLELPAGLDPDARYAFRLTATAPANLVLARCLLDPDDHVAGADPDVIAALRESHLPLLRWPGGNFASGYHWQDGVGPLDARRTHPNPAWSCLEYNLFGTNEFMSFCEAVGCTPMICVNAGDGTPEEAAAWVQYCNGAADTPMGRRRTADGHPEPYGVKLWEIGNELWGRWQVGRTTPAGNVDRFRRFADAMLAVDSTLDLVATGPQCNMDQEWTHALLAADHPALHTLTDHLLSGASIGPENDPWDVFQAYMGHATDAARQYRWLRERMAAAGLESPALALTEMQIFSHWQPRPGATGAMTAEQCITPATLAEACSFATFLCESIRLGGFVGLITHSATVNHGGGLRKERERVYANPVHHAHTMAWALAGAEPVAVDLQCATYATSGRYGFIPPLSGVPELDAVAARHEDGRLVVLLAQRGRGPLRVRVRVPGRTDRAVSATVLAGAAPWDQNRFEARQRVAPVRHDLRLTDGMVELDLTPAAVAVLVL